MQLGRYFSFMIGQKSCIFELTGMLFPRYERSYQNKKDDKKSIMIKREI